MSILWNCDSTIIMVCNNATMHIPVNTSHQLVFFIITSEIKVFLTAESCPGLNIQEPKATLMKGEGWKVSPYFTGPVQVHSWKWRHNEGKLYKDGRFQWKNCKVCFEAFLLSLLFISHTQASVAKQKLECQVTLSVWDVIILCITYRTEEKLLHKALLQEAAHL